MKTETPNLDYKNLKNESPKTELGIANEIRDLWQEKVRLLEKQYYEDKTIKEFQRQRAEIVEKAIPIGLNLDYSYIFDDSTQQRLDYLEKQLNDYIMQNYISLLASDEQ